MSKLPLAITSTYSYLFGSITSIFRSNLLANQNILIGKYSEKMFEIVIIYAIFCNLISECIRINDVEICGCPQLDKGTNHIQGSIDARFTRDASDNSQVIMFLNWTDGTWKKAINITYFKVQIRNGRSIILNDYVNASSNVYQYNKTIFNLTYGVNYYLSIYGYHGDHCLYEYVEALDFTAIPACENSSCSKRKPNSICQPDGYHGNHKCNCDVGFFSNDNKCI
ncbi:Hypothetical predicted protein, partial [Paramuricea clavata]